MNKDKHQLVFLEALRIIALPVSNPFVERISSACTWLEDPLRQCLNPARFEISVFLTLNEALLSETVLTEEEAHKIVDKFIDFFGNSDPGLDTQMNLGVDPDVECFNVEEEDENEDNKGVEGD